MSYLVQLISVMLHMKNEIWCRKQNIPFIPNILPVKHQALLRNCISNCCAKKTIFFFVSNWRESIKSLTYGKKLFLASKANWMIFLLLLSSMEKFSKNLLLCAKNEKLRSSISCVFNEMREICDSVEMKTAECEK